jgi:hypothetical protein
MDLRSNVELQVVECQNVEKLLKMSTFLTPFEQCRQLGFRHFDIQCMYIQIGLGQNNAVPFFRRHSFGQNSDKSSDKIWTK